MTTNSPSLADIKDDVEKQGWYVCIKAIWLSSSTYRSDTDLPTDGGKYNYLTSI